MPGWLIWLIAVVTVGLIVTILYAAICAAARYDRISEEKRKWDLEYQKLHEKCMQIRSASSKYETIAANVPIPYERLNGMKPDEVTKEITRARNQAIDEVVAELYESGYFVFGVIECDNAAEKLVCAKINVVRGRDD